MAKKILIIKNISREGPGLLAEILNSNNIEYDIIDLDKGKGFPNPKEYSAVFVFGGPDSANDTTSKMQEELKRIKETIKMGLPFFGVCLGIQALVKACGGEIYKSKIKEIGWRDIEGNFFEIELTKAGKTDSLFTDVNQKFKIFHLHGETVRLTKKTKLLGKGKYCPDQIIKVGNCAYGFQGHLELTTQMLNERLIHDSDLSILDHSSLKEDYNKIKSQYELNARKIFTNFLQLIGIIK